MDTIDVPEIVNDKETGEDDFLKILDWLDIWISLLTTNGMLWAKFIDLSVILVHKRSKYSNLINCLYKEYSNDDERQINS